MEDALMEYTRVQDSCGFVNELHNLILTRDATNDY